LSRFSKKARKFLLDEWPAMLMAAFFFAAMFTLQLLQHNAFNSRIGDFARFSQGIWSVLDGRFLWTPNAIRGQSLMANHFSPILVVAAPFFLVWPDERVLFVVQSINITATGLILYRIMKEERPNLAPWFLLLFFLNPAVHDFTLADFRRIFFGLPWMALAMLGLVRKDRRLLLIGLLIALLSKETVSLYIAMIGIYLLVVEKDWKWGISLFIFGMTALVFLTVYLIPAFGGREDYPLLFYYAHLGDGYSEIAKTIVTRPIWFLQQVFGPNQLWGIFRILLPLGFLCLLAPRVTLICAPFALLMFMSGRSGPIQLEEHYSASMMPILFTAIVIGLRQVAPKWDRWIIGWMMLSVLTGYLLFSHAPFGGRYQPSRFRVDDHDRSGNLMVKRIPEDISLLAHTTYTPHLTHIDDLHIFLDHHSGTPFSEDRIAAADYILIDRYLAQPNLGLFETEDVVQELLANPNFKIIEEIDGIYFFEQTTSDYPAVYPNIVFGETMHLEKVELSTTGQDSFFAPFLLDGSSTVAAGSQLRVSLFWESLAEGAGERTVSVRVSAADGFLLAQWDQIPAEAKRPTAFWKKGEKIRDVYYLELPADRAGQTVTVDLVVYDTFTQEIYPAAGVNDIYHISPLHLK
jgi:uncharacterized membrane protein